MIYNIISSIKIYFKLNKIFTMFKKSYYSNIYKVKTEYYILSNTNCMIKYFLKQNTYYNLSLNY